MKPVKKTTVTDILPTDAMWKPFIIRTYRIARRWAIAVIGASVVLIGIAMIVLPGPAILVIPAGLTILASEFAWARHWLAAVKRRAGDVLGNGRDKFPDG